MINLNFLQELFSDLILDDDPKRNKEELKKHLIGKGYEVMEKLHVFGGDYLDFLAVKPGDKKSQFILHLGGVRVRQEIIDRFVDFRRLKEAMPCCYLLRNPETEPRVIELVNVIGLYNVAEHEKELREIQKEEYKKNYWSS